MLGVGIAQSALVAETASVRGMDCFGRGFNEKTSRRRLSSQISASQLQAEGVLRTQSGQIRAQREDSLLNRLENRWIEKRDRFQPTRDDVRKITQQILLDVLASEWLSDDVETVEVRIYIVDNILPTLILGLEKLLVEVDKKGLVDKDETDRNFNPINHLAQYLMRNNPKYSNFSEASPYIRGLRSVSEQLKQELLHATDNKLAHMKLITRKKREERERAAAAAAAELKRRRVAIEKQFYEWNNGQKVPVSLIQNAFTTFAEMDKSALFSGSIEPTDDTGKGYFQADFTAYVLQHIGSTFTNEQFDEFIKHSSHCATYYRQMLQTENLQEQFVELFKLCDRTKLGIVDRSRLLLMFELFYKKAPQEVKDTLMHPKQWPLADINHAIEVIEEEPKQQEEEEEEGEEEQEEEEEEEVELHSTLVISASESAGEMEEHQSTEEVKPEEIHEEAEPEEAGEMIAETEEATVEFEGMAEEANEAEADGEEEQEDGSNAEEIAEPSPSMLLEAIESEEAVDVTDRPKPITTGSRMIETAPQTYSAILDDSVKIRQDELSPPYQVSLFAKDSLTEPQFSQLLQLFLCNTKDPDVIRQLITFVNEGYIPNEAEDTARKAKVEQQNEELKKKKKLNGVFEYFDNDSSGFLNLEFVDCSLKLFKQLEDSDTVSTTIENLRKKISVSDGRLTKHDFRTLVAAVADAVLPKVSVDELADFLQSTVAKSPMETKRGELRKHWLRQILAIADTCTICIRPVYEAIFAAMFQDGEVHGQEKHISGYIALLERNTIEADRGTHLLRYTGYTPNHSEYLMGQILYQDMTCVSFDCIDTGVPIHVANVSKHGGIYFWNTDKTPRELGGSLVIIPLKDRRKQIFGVMGIDTLMDPRNACSRRRMSGSQDMLSCLQFTDHEIDFYQGLARVFSIAYHRIGTLQRFVDTCEYALPWILRWCQNIQCINVYVAEYSEEIFLYHLLSTDDSHHVVTFEDPKKLGQQENVFCGHLFTCLESSQPVCFDAFDHRHLVMPVHNKSGQVVLLIDMDIGQLKALPRLDQQLMTRLLRLLNMATVEIMLEMETGDLRVHIDADLADNDTRTRIHFDRLLLIDVRKKLGKFSDADYHQVFQMEGIPLAVHDIVKGILLIFEPDFAETAEVHVWESCIPYLVTSLNEKLIEFDPTLGKLSDETLASLHGFVDGWTYESIAEIGSELAQCLYEWLVVCVSLMGRMRSDASSVIVQE